MGEVEKLMGELVHQRKVTVSTYLSSEEGSIVVEGRLDDERKVETISMRGDKLAPGPIHGMVVRLLIGGLPPVIKKAEAEMPKVPVDLCTGAEQSVKGLEGLAIASGYSREVKNRLGGPSGCAHLTALVLAMGGAAVQGGATARGRLGGPSKEERKAIVGFLKNTCHLWKEDGHYYKKALEEVEE